MSSSSHALDLLFQPRDLKHLYTCLLELGLAIVDAYEGIRFSEAHHDLRKSSPAISTSP